MAKKTKTVNQVTGAVISVTLRLLVLAVVVLVLWTGAVKGFEFGYEIFNGAAVAQSPGLKKTLVLNEGDSAKKVGNELEDQGLIKSSLIFQIQCKFFDYEMTPGTYTLDPSMTSREMLQAIDAGPKEEDTNDSE